MQSSKVYVVNGRNFSTGQLAGKNVVVFLSGISMVNAAMTTQQVFDYFNVSHLVFSGIAGGVNPNLNIGDAVVPAQWAEYQETTYARASADGSFVAKTDLPNFGMSFLWMVGVVRKNGEPDVETSLRWFQVDASMLKSVRLIAGQPVISRCGKVKNNNPICLVQQPKVIVGGNGVSGSTFVDNTQFREYAWQVFHSDALDMESAAVAHVCYVNAVPFMVFRALSDLAGGGPGENEMSTILSIAADNSAALVYKFLETWTPEASVSAP
jgi:adenosylhomocysteine nucleosidase